jgi:hypothetical protein
MLPIANEAWPNVRATHVQLRGQPRDFFPNLTRGFTFDVVGRRNLNRLAGEDLSPASLF